MDSNIQLMILKILLREHSTNQTSIAREVGVSTRTVSRHIAHLTINGVPITTKSGRNGGVYIDKRYKFTSQLLDEEEITMLFALLEIGEHILEMKYKDRLREKIVFLNPDANELIKCVTSEFFCVDIKKAPIMTEPEPIETIRKALKQRYEVEIVIGNERLQVLPLTCVLQEEGLFIYVRADGEYLLILLNSIQEVKLCPDTTQLIRSECIPYTRGMQIKKVYGGHSLWKE